VTTLSEGGNFAKLVPLFEKAFVTSDEETAASLRGLRKM
jgi:hypothetical protein